MHQTREEGDYKQVSSCIILKHSLIPQLCKLPSCKKTVSAAPVTFLKDRILESTSHTEAPG